MEAAFVDIATPKNAVLYAGDVQYDADDLDSGGKGEKRGGKQPRIEDVLKAKQSILTQVTKNPIAHKGARLTQEVSLPGRFVVLVPNSSTYGISKRLPDGERKRSATFSTRPSRSSRCDRSNGGRERHRRGDQGRRGSPPRSMGRHREALEVDQGPGAALPRAEAAVRIIREEFTKDFRGVIIDDKELYEEVKGYVEAITPALADRIEYYDEESKGCPVRAATHRRAAPQGARPQSLAPGGGSLIIEGTEALTVIDVNTGKNVGKSSLEETVFRNNSKRPRRSPTSCVCATSAASSSLTSSTWRSPRTGRGHQDLPSGVGRDKTRTQVFDISELGLVEMTPQTHRGGASRVRHDGV